MLWHEEKGFIQKIQINVCDTDKLQISDNSLTQPDKH